MWSLLFLCTIGSVLATQCWLPPSDLNCSGPTDPGTVGNMAFLALQYPRLWEAGAIVATRAKTELGPAWIETVPVGRYHISISYLFCMLFNDTQPLRKALESFKWDAFEVVVDHVQCEPGFIEMALDATSQIAVANFSVALREHVIAAGINYPDRISWQPPFHITVGLYNETVAPLNWSLPIFVREPIRITLNVFYFGSQPYFASIAIGNDIVWIIMLSIAGICCCFAFLPWVLVSKRCC